MQVARTELANLIRKAIKNADGLQNRDAIVASVERSRGKQLSADIRDIFSRMGADGSDIEKLAKNLAEILNPDQLGESGFVIAALDAIANHSGPFPPA